MALIEFDKTSPGVAEVVDGYGHKTWVINCDIIHPYDDIKLTDISKVKGSISCNALTSVEPLIVEGELVTNGDLTGVTIDAKKNVFIGGKTSLSNDMFVEGESVLNDDVDIDGKTSFKRGVKALKNLTIAKGMAFAVHFTCNGTTNITNGVTPILNNIKIETLNDCKV